MLIKYILFIYIIPPLTVINIDDKISVFFWFVIVSKKRLKSGLRNRAEKQIIV